MKLLNFERVLCISPHPDDVELGMSGTILKYEDTKFDILCLTVGGDFDNTTSLVRLNEIEVFWNNFGNKNVSLFKTPYELLNSLNEDGWINYIEVNYVNKFNYDCIFLPNEYDSHFEHRFVAGFGKTLIRKKSINLVQYYTPSTYDNWTPNFYVDIDDVYKRKIKCLKYFESQSDRFYFEDHVLRAFHSDFQCSKKKINYVEKYKILDLFVGRK
jgi:LmbE family N-acetylglucosaminyl deacetylase|tara:strand:- start:557 stop:1198 length:642 start_codon:yes stop_codon:yes gene_type:complete